MAKRKDNQPVRPYYISDSETVCMDWSNNFAEKLPTVAAKYHIPTTLVDKVVNNNLALQAVGEYETVLGGWLSEYRVLKNSFFDGNPTNKDPLPYPSDKTLPRLPEVLGSAYILAPHIQAANILLADPTLTENDKALLRLVPASGKPVPPEAAKREKAEDYSYPLIQAKVSNGKVVLRIIRGKKYKGKAALILVDRKGLGNFSNLINTTGASATDAIVLPEGQYSGAWTYRAVYMEGDVEISEWCPDLTVAVKVEAPNMELVGMGK